ncbi:MAG: addiction module protein [Verrucomicrobia bacterium]|nr:addiction module protein [Verrucomicrobiota bacterium]
MEALWDDITQDASGLPVPQCHQEVLAERETKVAEGTARYIDWEIAKREILAAVK